MRRHGIIGAFLCILAVWVQVMVPVEAATLDSADPLGRPVLCAHDSLDRFSTPDDHGTSLPPVSHEHCLLCQVCLGGALIPERPAFTALDYPVASPLRWSIEVTAPLGSQGLRPGQPRGPPALI